MRGAIIIDNQANNQVFDEEIDSDTIDYGTRFQQLRNAVGYTQEQVATLLNFHIKTISQYENNNRKPNYSTLRKLADLYNTTIDYMLFYDVKECILISDLSKQNRNLARNLVNVLRTENKTKK